MCVLSVVLLLVMAIGAFAAGSRDGLVVWYTFEEGKGEVVKDLSGNGNDARLVNAPTWTNGRNGLAMEFNGQGAYLDCGNDRTLRLTQNFTVAFWVKADAQPDWYAVTAGWTKSVNQKMRGWSVYVGRPAHQPHFYSYDPLWSMLSNGPGMDTNEWQHVCYTIGPDLQAVAYVNGTPHSRSKMPKPLTSHDGNLQLGGLGSAENYSLQGALDDFRLYNRALTEKDVRDLYEAAVAGIATPEEFALRDAVSLSSMGPDYGVLQLGKNRIEVSCTLPAALRPPNAGVHLLLRGDSKTIIQQPVPYAPDGSSTVVLRVPRTEPGLYTLITQARLPDGRILKESRRPVTVCRTLRNGEGAARRVREGDVWIFDEFDKLTPAIGISQTKKAHSWFLEDYSFGKALPKHRYLASDGLVYVLKYALPLKGSYAVYLGLVNPGKGVEVGISQERPILKAYAPERPAAEGAPAIDEKFLQYADLTGNEVLTLNGPSKMTPNGLAYVKFLRLTRSQMKIVRAENDPSNEKKYIFYDDGELFMFQSFLSAETIAKDFTKYKRGLDRLDMFAIGGGGSVMYYPTRVGTRLGPRPGDSYAAQGVTRLCRFMDAGNDPLAIIADTARKHGINLEINLRMAWHGADGYHENSRFRNESPQFRLLPTPTASPEVVLDYFYPEVREERIRLFEEIIARYSPDAICADFTRWPRSFGVAAAGDFEKEFGRKPRFHDANDWEWYRFRAGFMTDMIRRIHKLRLEHQRKTGKRVEFRAILTSRHFLLQGLDVETWIREGIVDALMPGTDYVNYEASDVDIETFVKMTRATPCKVYVRLDISMRAQPTENEVKQIFWQCFQRGADGVYLYNQPPFRSPDLYGNLERWSVFEDVDKCPIIPICKDGTSPVEARP